jgi:hypothetical protein
MTDDIEQGPADLGTQTSVEMPNGVVLTGVGEHDVEAAQDTFEQRQDELHPPPPTREPRQPRGQKRFDQLTAEREAANRRAEAAEQRTRELEARLAQPPAAQPSAEPAARPPAVQQPTRPKPLESDIGTKYKTLSEYFEDLGSWQYEQREAALFQTFDARLQAGIEADRASRTRTDHAQSVFTAGRAAFSDFDATLATVNDIILSPSHQDAILKMPNAERIMYALAKDREALQAVAKESDPVMLGVRLATLNVSDIPRTEAVAPRPASTPVAVRQSTAPAPPQPVGGGSRTAQASSAEIANSGGSYEQFKQRRNAERGIH